MKTTITGVLVSGFIAIGLCGSAHAGAAPEDAIATLHKRGYTSVEVVPDETPGYQAMACKGGTRFEVTLDRETNIIDVDPRCSCGGGRDYAAGPPPGQVVPHDAYKGDYRPHPVRTYHPVYGPIFDQLYARGYYDIRVIDEDDDEIEVLACRNGRLYELEIEFNGRIDDIDKKGRCKSRRYGKRIEAPFASVDTYRGNVDVEAPFAGVHVGRGEVVVRAPFVDLRIPK